MKNKIKKIAIIYAIFAAILSGCGKKYIEDSNVQIYKEFNDELDTEVKTLDMNTQGQAYIDMGVYYKSICKNDGEINLQSKEPFSGFYSIINEMNETKNFTLVILDNYRQTEFEVDKKLMKSCTFCLGDGNSIDVPIRINELSDGVHRLLFLIFSNTYTKEKYDKDEFINGAVQATLFVGSRPYEDTQIRENIFLKQQIAESDGIQINKLDEKYFIETGNLQDINVTQIFILFDNYEQIEMPECGDVIGCVELEPGMKIKIPINNIIKDAEKDIHHNYVGVSIKKGSIKNKETDYVLFSNTFEVPE